MSVGALANRIMKNERIVTDLQKRIEYLEKRVSHLERKGRDRRETNGEKTGVVVKVGNAPINTGTVPPPPVKPVGIQTSFLPKKKVKIQTIRIISPSDNDPGHGKWWGDFWVKYAMQKVFKKRGYIVVDLPNIPADLDIFLHGSPYNLKNRTRITAPRRFCWFYSHPDFLTKDKETWLKFGKQFEHIFVLSNKFLPEVMKYFDNCSVLLGGTSKQLVYRDLPLKYDVAFVGNAGKPERIRLVKHLIKQDKYRICLVGTPWKSKLGHMINKVDFRGPYIENRELCKLFNESQIAFYSSHEDMRREGFVAVRILDICAGTECLCITDDNPGLTDIFTSIPTYKSPDDLVQKIDWYMQHPKEREETIRRCRTEASEYTFERVVDEIVKFF